LVPYKAFPAADGWVVIGAGVQNLFERFLQVINRTDLLFDPRFADVKARVANRDEVHRVLDAEVRRFNVSELIEKLGAAKVPCSPINDMEGVFTHPQALHRGMVQKVKHDEYGELNVIGPAVKYGNFDVAAGWTAPPLLGEHTEEVTRDWLN
jgi:succinate--hydroxymethylglutarate CoA-transferase